MSEQENKELRKLININEDACEFYETAQEKAESMALKNTFGNLEDLHKGVVITLQNCVRSNAGNAEAEDTFIGQAQQFWTNLMAKISNDVDETLVKNLEEAEDRCLHSMQDAMDKDTIRPEIKNVLKSELFKLQKSHAYMKELKETMKAA